MFGNPFLQESGSSRNKHRQLDHLLRVTAPHERIIMAGIGLVMLALAAWALFGTVVRGVTIDGVLIKPGPRHEIISTKPGYLMEFLVAPGDHVEIGDPIIRQNVPELERETTALRERLEMLETKLQQLRGERTRDLRSLLTSVQMTLLQMEAQRSASELIVSPIAGEIMALRSAPGEYLPTGTAVAQIRDAEDQPLQAVLRVAPDMAQHVQPDMRTSVEIMMPDGATRRLDGVVASVTPGPLPNWLAALRPPVTDSVHRIDVVLLRASELSVPDGTPCRVRIVLGQQLLTTFFDFRRS